MGTVGDVVSAGVSTYGPWAKVEADDGEFLIDAKHLEVLPLVQPPAPPAQDTSALMDALGQARRERMSALAQAKAACDDVAIVKRKLLDAGFPSLDAALDKAASESASQEREGRIKLDAATVDRIADYAAKAAGDAVRIALRGRLSPPSPEAEAARLARVDPARERGVRPIELDETPATPGTLDEAPTTPTRPLPLTPRERAQVDPPVPIDPGTLPRAGLKKCPSCKGFVMGKHACKA